MKLKNQSGSLTIWLAGMLPLLIIILALFINIALLVDNRIAMQSAVDRGVYAGASYLSHVMNEVARLNWQFRKKYLNLQDAFRNSDENYDSIKDKIDELNNYQNNIIYEQEMRPLLEKGYERAHGIARYVAFKNIENIDSIKGEEYFPEYGVSGTPLFDMVNECEGEVCVNKETLFPYEIKGSAYDPTDYKAHPKVVHKYLVKSDSFVAIAASLRGKFLPPVVSWFFDKDGTGVPLNIVAAAQPYGGSIKDYSHVPAKDLKEANILGAEYLYHPSLIPVKLLREDLDVSH